tara:strand:+ start:1230 stop:1790 length:561 start_codon:yes stop_codon:yes gene_type:complete
MDNVLNTIKDSCSNLKYNKLIDDQQYKLCESLFSKQKWRQELDKNNHKHQVDAFTNIHMAKYDKLKKILDSSVSAIVNAENKEYYQKKVEYVKSEIKKNVSEFEKYSKENDSKKIFREYVAKQSVYNKNKKTMKKQNDNLDFIETKQKIVNESIQNEQYITLIYSVIFFISMCAIIIISLVILYYE